MINKVSNLFSARESTPAYVKERLQNDFRWVCFHQGNEAVAVQIRSDYQYDVMQLDVEHRIVTISTVGPSEAGPKVLRVWLGPEETDQEGEISKMEVTSVVGGKLLTRTYIRRDDWRFRIGESEGGYSGDNALDVVSDPSLRADALAIHDHGEAYPENENGRFRLTNLGWTHAEQEAQQVFSVHPKCKDNAPILPLIQYSTVNVAAAFARIVKYGDKRFPNPSTDLTFVFLSAMRYMERNADLAT